MQALRHAYLANSTHAQRRASALADLKEESRCFGSLAPSMYWPRTVGALLFEAVFAVRAGTQR